MDGSKGFGNYLKILRVSLGFSSALAFYDDLSKKADLEFNYSYYKRFENGEILPSVKVINSLVHLLSSAASDELILQYCAACFPTKKKIFQINSKSTKAQNRIEKKRKIQNLGTRNPQKILNEKEIQAICSHKTTYYLFLLMTLSDGRIKKKNLLSLFSRSELETSIETLSKVKILYREDDDLVASYSEFAFPEGHSTSLQFLYKKLDIYDRERNEFFKLEKKFSSEVFRKVSSRHTDLITEHLHLLLKAIRMADDSNPDLNDHVLAFSFNLSLGKSVV